MYSRVATYKQQLAGHPINEVIDMAAFPMKGIFGAVCSTKMLPDGMMLKSVMHAHP